MRLSDVFYVRRDDSMPTTSVADPQTPHRLARAKDTTLSFFFLIAQTVGAISFKLKRHEDARRPSSSLGAVFVGTTWLTSSLSHIAQQRKNAMKCMRAMIEDAAKLGWGGKSP